MGEAAGHLNLQSEEHMSTTDASNLPVFDAEPDATYSLEVVAELTGMTTQTILHYREIGLIPPVAEAESAASLFNDETVRTLRRIEHLQSAFEMNEAVLKLTLGLMDEVELLREGLRRRR